MILPINGLIDACEINCSTISLRRRLSPSSDSGLPPTTTQGGSRNALKKWWSFKQEAEDRIQESGVAGVQESKNPGMSESSFL
jgi:hypothetical protein